MVCMVVRLAVVEWGLAVWFGEVLLHGAPNSGGERSVLGIGAADDGLLKGARHCDRTRLGVVSGPLATGLFGGWLVHRGSRAGYGSPLLNIIPTAREKLPRSVFLNIPFSVANSPHADTVTVSFTMPKEMSEAVNRRAKAELTNKSDIIRRALMAYLSPQELQRIKEAVAGRGVEKTG
jgi:hypothetical protein